MLIKLLGNISVLYVFFKVFLNIKSNQLCIEDGCTVGPVRIYTYIYHPLFYVNRDTISTKWLFSIFFNK